MIQVNVNLNKAYLAEKQKNILQRGMKHTKKDGGKYSQRGNETHSKR